MFAKKLYDYKQSIIDYPILLIKGSGGPAV